MATEPKERTMSEIEAAEDRTKRWRECCERDNHEDHEYWSDPQSQEDDEELLIDWALDRLASDRAEADERAKPIDVEFAVAALGGSMSFAAHALGGATVTVWATRLSPSGFGIGIVHGDTEYVHNLTITTRGQLLDLIRALKGGAT